MIIKPRSIYWSTALVSALAASPAHGFDWPAYLNAKDAGPDFAVQGEYLGTIGRTAKVGAQVVALGAGAFEAVLYTQGLPGAGWDGRTKVRLTGQTKDGVARFTGKNFAGTIKNGVFGGTAENDVRFQLARVERTSPTQGAPPPPGAIVLFDGKNTVAWQMGKIVDGNLLGVPAVTREKFDDFLLHIEFRTPFMPTSRGQGRGNSGVYLLDQYECQVLDSFGLEGLDNECGGIYQSARPLVNMCLPPLSWQTYDIEFRAPRFSPNGRVKRDNAVVTVRHNGVIIHYDLEIKHPTHGGHQTDELAGPIYLQDHHNPVRYRNIWLLPRR